MNSQRNADATFTQSEPPGISDSRSSPPAPQARHGPGAARRFRGLSRRNIRLTAL
jgi:hypothetical protein